MSYSGLARNVSFSIFVKRAFIGNCARPFGFPEKKPH
jgi:hypothetical protein